MTSLFVTGSTGGLGTHLIRRALDQGIVPTCLVRPETDLRELTNLGLQCRTDWRQALSESEPGSTVVHLAAFVHQDNRHAESAAAHWSINHELSVELGRAAAAAQISHFVFASTVAVYAQGSEHLAADSSTSPATPYGASKLRAEQDLSQLFSTSKTQLTNLRIPMVYGPHVKGNLIPLLAAAKRGWVLPLGRATKPRSFLYVENFADAVLHRLSMPAVSGSCETLLLADELDISPRELYETIFHRMNGTGRATFSVPASLFHLGGRIDDAVARTPLASLPLVSRIVGKVSALARRLFRPLTVERTPLVGWRPGISTAEGLERTVDWFVRRDQN